MQRLDYIRRIPGLSDYNTLVDAINSIMDKLETKIEIEEVVIERVVKDFKFFKWNEVSLPYVATYTLSSAEDASKVFDEYLFTYKEMNNINNLILWWKVVSLKVSVTEEVTEAEKKQEAVFEKVEAIVADKKIKTKKKRWRPKKTKRE